jgi:hypothetical protein
MYGIPADMGQMRAKYVNWATYDRMYISELLLAQGGTVGILKDLPCAGRKRSSGEGPKRVQMLQLWWGTPYLSVKSGKR